MSDEKPEVKAKAVPLPTIHLPEGHPMQGLIDSIPTPPSNGDLVEGAIIAISRGRVYVDLAPFGTGLIYGREYLNAADVLRKANPGDTISAKVVDAAGCEGYIELSLKEAPWRSPSPSWSRAMDADRTHPCRRHRWAC